MLDDEVWRDIIGYEGFYQISNKCRIRSLYNYKRDGTNILKPKIKRSHSRFYFNQPTKFFIHLCFSETLQLMAGKSAEPPLDVSGS